MSRKRLGTTNTDKAKAIVVYKGEPIIIRKDDNQICKYNDKKKEWETLSNSSNDARLLAADNEILCKTIYNGHFIFNGKKWIGQFDDNRFSSCKDYCLMNIAGFGKKIAVIDANNRITYSLTLDNWYFPTTTAYKSIAVATWENIVCFISKENNKVYKFEGVSGSGSGWTTPSVLPEPEGQDLKAIALAVNFGNVFMIDNNNKVYLHNTKKWKYLSGLGTGKAIDVSNDGYIYIIGMDDKIYRY